MRAGRLDAARLAPAVEVRDLTAGYAGKPILTGLDFSVAAGQRLGVLGPNGGGKTTLFRALLGELSPWHGTVHTDGGAGAVAQTERSRLDLPVSAHDVVLLGTIAARPWWRHASRDDRRAAHAALETVGLGEHADAGFGELSGGQRQRVLIARALVQQAQVLLLDEPFTGLDTASAERLERLIDELAADGRAILIATHDIVQTRTWDRVLCLHHRQIAFGAPASTLTPAVLEATYGRVTAEADGARSAVAAPA